MAKPVWSLAGSDTRRRIAVAAVLLIAVLLRMQHLGQPYVDEYAWRESDTASMASAFANGAWNIFLPQVRWGGPGPNYIGAEFQTVSYLAAIGYRLFGVAPWVGRAVSIAFGLWGIYALYQLVRRIHGTASGLAAAGVMAVLPGSVFIERSFLPDAAMTALMTTSLWMLVAFCQTNARRYLAAAALFGMLGCLTKLPGGILVVPTAYAAMSLLGPRLRDLRVLVRLGTAALVVTVPVIAYYLWARHIASSVPPYHFTGAGKFLWNGDIREWLRNDYYLPEFWQIVSTQLWGLPFIVLAAIGILRRPRAGESGAAQWLFHAWLMALFIRYVLEAKHLVTDPYNIHLFNPVIAVFAAQGLTRVATGLALLGGARTGAALAASLFVGAAVAGQAQTQHQFSDSYREHYVLGRLVATLSRPQDLVISMGLEPVLLYHSQRKGWVFPPEEIGTMQTGHEAFERDYARDDVAILHDLKLRGAQWLAIPSWNSYAGASSNENLRATYPALYAGIAADFALVRETPEGLIFRAR